MKTLLCLLVSFGVFFTLRAQEKELKLFIYQNKKGITNFGIANLRSKTEGVLKDGVHLINAKVGDELFIASNEFKNFYKLVTSTDIEQGHIEVYMEEGVIQLEEVVLNQQKLSYGTFTAKKPIQYTPAEGRLRAATKMYYKGDGLRLGLDPIINLISGRTKGLKKQLKAETSTLIVKHLEDNYRSYILEDLEVPRADFSLFCYYVSDQNKGIHKNKEKRHVEFLLKRLYMKFIQSSQQIQP